MSFIKFLRSPGPNLEAQPAHEASDVSLNFFLLPALIGFPPSFSVYNLLRKDV
jgi:hypothetical protein